MEKKSSDLVHKVNFLTNIDFQSYIDNNKDKSPGICRSCVDHISSAYSFVDKLRCRLLESQEVGLENTGQRLKRQTLSPLTPKIKGEYQGQSAVKKRCSSNAKRPLALPEESAKSPGLTTSEISVPETACVTQSTSTLPSLNLGDHSYSTTPKAKQASTKESNACSSAPKCILEKHLHDLEYPLHDANHPDKKNPVVEEILNTIFSNKVQLFWQ